MEQETLGKPTGEVKRNIPRDVFLHLLAVVTLYWSAVSFITLLWQFINYYFPDVLRYYYEGSIGTMRFAVSAIIIVFPVFIAVSWYLNKIYRREAVVRESKIRKWLIYLTLFIASLVIIGDLIYVINTFLSNGTTVRFILKALSIILVAGIIFGYYLDDVRREIPTKSAKYFVWVTSVLVLMVIVSAFFIIGSPSSAGLVQIDQQKVNDLSNIQYQIVNYWQRKEVMPANLFDLNDSISGFVVPTDPQTNQSYKYSVPIPPPGFILNSLTFELCATFNKPSQNDKTRMLYPVQGGIDQNWEHPAGDFCFERTIDKELYPPISKIK